MNTKNENTADHEHVPKKRNMLTLVATTPNERRKQGSQRSACHGPRCIRYRHTKALASKRAPPGGPDGLSAHSQGLLTRSALCRVQTRRQSARSTPPRTVLVSTQPSSGRPPLSLTTPPTLSRASPCVPQERGVGASRSAAPPAAAVCTLHLCGTWACAQGSRVGPWLGHW